MSIYRWKPLPRYGAGACPGAAAGRRWLAIGYDRNMTGESNTGSPIDQTAMATVCGLASRDPGRECRDGPSLVPFRLRQHLPLLVLRRQRRFRHAPVDAQRRVVPEQRALVLREPVVRGLVEHLGEFGANHEAVGEAGRDPELAPVGAAQLHRHMAPEVGGGAPHVDGNVQDQAAG